MILLRVCRNPVCGRPAAAGATLCSPCARQRDLERRSLEVTEQRYRVDVAALAREKRSSQAYSGHDLFEASIPRLAASLSAYLSKRRGDRRREGAAFFKWLNRTGPDRAARVTLKTVVDFFPAPRKLQ